jgi:hypothetical protein
MPYELRAKGRTVRHSRNAQEWQEAAAYLGG